VNSVDAGASAVVAIPGAASLAKAPWVHVPVARPAHGLGAARLAGWVVTGQPGDRRLRITHDPGQRRLARDDPPGPYR
jgi:hypothetical protein